MRHRHIMQPFHICCPGSLVELSAADYSTRKVLVFLRHCCMSVHCDWANSVQS